MSVAEVVEDVIRCFMNGQTLFVDQLPIGAQIQVFSLSGSLMAQEKVFETNYAKTLPMGVCILKVKSSNETVERKVLIQ